MSTEFINAIIQYRKKLQILADAAKYDVACTSSGSAAGGKKGDSAMLKHVGICQ